ncbi:Alpha/beta hydrolase family protein [Blastococcus aggregatus]|uniref:Alpha/beta hydrolase family protein n=1 Tax=Blastococcus aggregatus TaxID=38502 RepID=A0A285V8D8_9ACTN|nr:alpha/beta hydrolase family protein [Blastococcus aggregatus]SOC50340.1 Alpha/beta hydrolase family protein [Blastococcus aggregatus]
MVSFPVTTFVLVPGAGGNASYWQRLVPELARRGHRGLAVDLPAADPDAGLAAYADAVVGAVRASLGADPAPLVLVAQSMGGLTAPLVCDRLPVRLLVLLNAMVPRPGETGGAWWAATGHADPGDPTEAFFADVPPDVAAAVQAEPFEQSGRPFDDPWPLDRWPAVPTRVLAGRDDRFFPLAFQRRVAADRLGLPVDELPGGHLVALSRPAELAERLVAYLGS